MNLHKGWDKVIGNGAAYVQHGIDRAAEWGFHKMKQTGKTPMTFDPQENKYMRASKRAAKGVFKFLGNTGETYYKKYEELKRKP